MGGPRKAKRQRQRQSYRPTTENLTDMDMLPEGAHDASALSLRGGGKGGGTRFGATETGCCMKLGGRIASGSTSVSTSMMPES
jgi:hypothetical protein